MKVMKVFILFSVAVTLGAVGGCTSTGAKAVEISSSGKLVAEGAVQNNVMFSPDQVASGQSIYMRDCASCHSDNLSGGKGPALAGEDFAARWGGKTGRSLYSKIISTMPPQNPGSLSEEQTLQIMGYILSHSALEPADARATSAASLSNIILRFRRDQT
jgi:mono/diheme cytochrome c family protein